jgi:hypothetical protein
MLAHVPQASCGKKSPDCCGPPGRHGDTDGSITAMHDATAVVHRTKHVTTRGGAPGTGNKALA